MLVNLLNAAQDIPLSYLLRRTSENHLFHWICSQYGLFKWCMMIIQHQTKLNWKVQTPLVPRNHKCVKLCLTLSFNTATHLTSPDDNSNGLVMAGWTDPSELVGGFSRPSLWRRLCWNNGFQKFQWFGSADSWLINVQSETYMLKDAGF